MEMETSDEPLNLTLKKMPIAIVAPFSIIDANQNHKINNNNNNNNYEVKTDLHQSLNKCDDLPEDLTINDGQFVIKNKNNDQCLDLSKTNNKDKDKLKFVDHNEQLRKYLCKNRDDIRNDYNNKNTFNEQDLKLLNDYQKINDLYSNLTTASKNLSGTDTISSFINNLTDNKFLATWYLNSVLNQHNPYLNFSRATSQSSSSTFNNDKNDNNTSQCSSSNRILNNLLDKKAYNTYKFPTNYNALIKNEMRNDKINSKIDHLSSKKGIKG